MTEDRKYVRVYYNDLIRDYPDVWANDAALATWLRMLATADPMWPTPPELPRSVRPKPLAELTKQTLVDVLPANRYRMKGMDAERERRQSKARASADARWSGRNADGLRTHSERNAARSARLGSDSVSDSEGGAGGTEPLTQAVDYIEGRSGRPWQSRPGQKLWDTLTADIRDFGIDAVVSAMTQLPGHRLDHGQLVFGASNRLHPIDRPKGGKSNGTHGAEEAERAFSRS